MYISELVSQLVIPDLFVLCGLIYSCTADHELRHNMVLCSHPVRGRSNLDEEIPPSQGWNSSTVMFIHHNYNYKTGISEWEKRQTWEDSKLHNPSPLTISFTQTKLWHFWFDIINLLVHSFLLKRQRKNLSSGGLPPELSLAFSHQFSHFTPINLKM